MSVFDHVEFDKHESIHFFNDEATGLRAIIAVHSTALGPGAGGCRRWTYAKDADAITDALLGAGGTGLDIGALFPDNDIRLFDAVPVGFHCDCSEERIDNMLRMLGPDELNDLIAQQDPVEISCEFCNRQYLRPAEQIYALVAELTGGTGNSLH